MATTAIILKHERQLADTLVIAQLPSGEQVSFRATSQANAIAILRDLAKKRDVTKDTDPVTDGPVELDIAAAVPPDPPTRAEIDRAKWFADFSAERTQQTLGTLTATLASRYKPEYGDVR